MFSSNATQVSDAAYIEDVFSTWLYTGNGSTQTINNGIDLAGKGGLVWVKNRSSASNHAVFDTLRGGYTYLSTNLSSSATTDFNSLSNFNASGFNLGSSSIVNASGANFASWTFREQPRFFDIVTYVGDGVAGRQIAHSLGSVPGCIIVKNTNDARDWAVWHRTLADGTYLKLNTTDSVITNTSFQVFGDASGQTSTVFTVGKTGSGVNGLTNANGGTYVAYLFAHDAGGFGATGADNVISCGGYTGNGSTQTISLGWEPQWILIKKRTIDNGIARGWILADNMRGIVVDPAQNYAQLTANTASAEGLVSEGPVLNSTGFGVGNSDLVNGSGEGYIYIAIRRGPMKTPTSGTSVFGLNARTGTGANATVTGGQTDDAVLIKNRGAAVASLFSSRLTGTGYLVTSSTAAEVAAGTTILQANPWDVMDGVKVGTTSTTTNASANTFINYLFRRAPGFFDVVCVTSGTGTANPSGVGERFPHNLGVVPEMMIWKTRNASGTDWFVYHAGLSGGGENAWINLNTTSGQLTAAGFWSAAQTATTCSIRYTSGLSASSNTLVAYLFASCPGVSKVGSFTGTGGTQVINCGFSSGARFVLIKRTDSTGDWYVWDSARGIVAGNDPYLLLNSTAAEVTNTDWVDTAASGFELSNAAGNLVNTNGGSYIFLSVS